MTPYAEGVGYVPYPAFPEPMPDTLTDFQQGYSLAFRFNQVFEHIEFPKLMAGLWKSFESGGPTMFKANLKVLDNVWFGVKGGRNVEVLFVYNQDARDFQSKLQPSVVEQLTGTNFPHLALKAHYTPAVVNMLGHLSAWGVVSASSTLSAMFTANKPNQPKHGPKHKSHSGLSGGDIAGIVIGCVVGVGVLVGAVVVYTRRGRKHDAELSHLSGPDYSKF
mmetsp:Transcript_53959/g.127413  ORF Transcript_53959/g.127413 Transcript_53959/m.127413 type:complete len:220 (-) Transcript_53959:20-679(-)